MDPNFTASDVDSAVPAVGPTTPNNAEPNAYLTNDILEKIRVALESVISATEAAEGLIKIASDAAVAGGVGSDAAVTPESLAQYYARLTGGANANFTAMPQVGGSAIVSSGSNANGSWIKFSDGTMVCYSDIYVPGSGVSGSGAYTHWTYPAPFISAPSVIGTARYVRTTDSFFNARADLNTISRGTTSCQIIVLYQTDSPTFSAEASVAAIGRWKA